MKTIAVRIGLAVMIVFAINNLSPAQNCKDANELIDLAEKGPPEEMTEEYFKLAVDLCPQNAEIYRRIADYYRRCYKIEINYRKQARCLDKAIAYYKEGIKWAEGDVLTRMKKQHDELQSRREFSRQGFQKLPIARAGATGAGLNLKIHFKAGSHRLTGDAQGHLDQLGRILVENKSIRVSLEGHTDRSGNRADNLKLSVQRAKSAKRYLVEKFKIASDRMLTSGYGCDRPANIHDPYSAENRRVEVIKLSE